MATDYNSVPLGQAGTGSSFVLGRSTAADKLVDTLDYNRKVEQQNALLRQQQAQQLAQSWKQNALKVEGGLYWKPEFDKRYQGHLEKGIQLRQMGIDPFNYNANNPQESAIAENYLLERQGILSDTANRKSTEAEIKKSFDMVRKDPTKYYASDVANLNKFIETPYADAMNMPIPTLEERFNPNTVLAKVSPAQIGSELVVGNKRIKSVKALPDETRSAIVSGYSNDPSTSRWVNELTGNQGFTISALEAIPNTQEAIKKSVEASYNGNPQLRTELATKGITPNSDKYKEYVNGETKRLYDAKSKWNNQIQSDLNQVLPKVKGMSSILPDYTNRNQERADERLSNERERLRLAQTKKSGEDEGVLYRQKTVNDMLNGVEGSGERFKAIVGAMPGYDKQEVDNMIGSKGNFLEIRVPAKTVESADAEGKVRMKVIPEYKVTIDKRSPEGKLKLNRLLSDITGENISESKFQTGNAGGKVKGAVQTERDRQAAKPTKTVPISKIEGLVGKKGYEGYTKKELIDYYKSQGYTIK